MNAILRCPNCGAKNRVPQHRLGDRAVCGKCKSPLSSAIPYPESSIEVTDQTFDREILRFPGSVVVEFQTPRCGYCRKFDPIFYEEAGEFAGRIKFARINADHNSATMSRYGVQGTPTLLLFKNSRLVDRIPGAVDKEEFRKHLLALL